MPKKLSEDSVTIAAERLILYATRSGAIELGRTCVRMILWVGIPIARAASIYSFSLTESTRPYARRQKPGHPRNPITPMTVHIEVPRIATMNIAAIIIGMDMNISVTRMMIIRSALLK